jgi:hypothetical protein
MTSIVGITCQNGIIIGTDSSATFAAGRMPTIEQPTEKLEVFGGRVIVAGTGQVGLGQRFSAIMQNALAQGVFDQPHVEVGKTLSKAAIDDFRQTYVSPGQYGALVAFPCRQQLHLCEFALSDFQPEFKTDKLWYVSMGSAQPITDPFLALMREIFWGRGCPSVQDGVFAVLWSLQHAVSVNPGGVNSPIRISVLTSENGTPNARLLDEADLDEHSEHIEYAKNLLRDYRKNLSPRPGAFVPDIPRPT